MIGFDTNILVRFITADDELQYAKTSRLVQETVERDETIFISDITLCELVWVLESGYKTPKEEILSVLLSLFQSPYLVFNSIEQFYYALISFENYKGDFADYMIREQSFQNGCSTIYTFEKILAREEGFINP